MLYITEGRCSSDWTAHSVLRANVKRKWTEMGNTEKEGQWFSAAFDIGSRREGE